jgi:hypothetical protein
LSDVRSTGVKILVGDEKARLGTIIREVCAKHRAMLTKIGAMDYNSNRTGGPEASSVSAERLSGF